MADDATTIGAVKEAIKHFAAEREWERFHNPKNLVMALNCEVAELMEHFLWVEGEASRRVVDDAAEREQVADELADVCCLLMNLSLATGIDLSEAVRAKLVKNEQKYPAEKYRGRWKT